MGDLTPLGSAFVRIWGLLTFAVLTFFWNCGVGVYESGKWDVLRLTYLGMDAFVGGYAPVPGQPGIPSTAMVSGLIVALMLTFVTAAAAYVDVTRSRWRKAVWSRRSFATVILGNSDEASAIAASARAGDVAVFHAGAVDTHTAARVTGWPDISADRAVRRAVRRAEYVIVADSDDVISADVARRISSSIPGVDRRMFQLVQSQELNRALRPPVISGDFPGWERFSVEDNIAQLLVEVVLGLSSRSKRALTVHVRSPSQVLLDWLGNALEAECLLGEPASFELVDTPEADVILLTGDGPEVVATALENGHTVIAVAPLSLFTTIPWARDRVIDAQAWLRDGGTADILVIDPVHRGLHYRLITDGVATQWGRAYHRAHTMRYRENEPWNPEVFGKNEQSSIGAAMNMLVSLHAQGFELATTGEVANFTGDEVSNLARAEHVAWLERTWTDPAGEEIPCSYKRNVVTGSYAPGPDGVAWDELSEHTREYNRWVPAKMYPALAALFGYVIRRIDG